MDMVLFTNQRKFHRPGAGTSPAHEAGVPTNWCWDSWNDDPPSRSSRTLIYYSGLRNHSSLPQILKSASITITIAASLLSCQAFTTSRPTEYLTRHLKNILSMKRFSVSGIGHNVKICIATTSFTATISPVIYKRNMEFTGQTRITFSAYGTLVIWSSIRRVLRDMLRKNI